MASERPTRRRDRASGRALPPRRHGRPRRVVRGIERTRQRHLGRSPDLAHTAGHLGHANPPLRTVCGHPSERMSDYDPRDYEPIHPRGTDWGGRLRKATGPIIAGVIALAKWSFVLVKFSSIFIAVAAYALIWGWKFGVGVVLLILL